MAHFVKFQRKFVDNKFSFLILTLNLTSTLFIFSSLAKGSPAILLEDAKNQQQVKKGWSIHESRETRESQEFSDSHESFESFDDFYTLRAKKRVGVGFTAAGQYGLYGLNIELNFTTDESAMFGFGGGAYYNTFVMGWKHIFGGSVVSPYLNFSFAHWYANAHRSLERSKPEFLVKKYLSEEEVSLGRFSRDFIIPSFGLQVNQLFGQYTGTSLFAEVNFLIDSTSLSYSPTGALGFLYYF